MPAVNEQWTRGAGGGIGMSDHQNSFQYVLAYSSLRMLSHNKWCQSDSSELLYWFQAWCMSWQLGRNPSSQQPAFSAG